MNAFWRFVDRFPSPVTEFVSGLLTDAVAAGLLWVAGRFFGPLLLPYPVALGIAATGLSLVYEMRLDANGWSLRDVAQREVGILAGCLLAWVA